MARKFEIPLFYRSGTITSLKQARHEFDHRKKNLRPTLLDLGPIRFKVARHFGFCFGVENAIHIAYKALEDNPTKRVFLLSEMIHNAHVNNDLLSRGVRFILAADGAQLIPFEELKPDDIVIVPAFGTTTELFRKLESLGINTQLYNATCPFVEKVWKRSFELGKRGYTVIIHGKHYHEETRATFSHARLSAPSLVIRDMEEAKKLAGYISHLLPWGNFKRDFADRFSMGFDPETHLVRIGVVNQTTMLATETQAISELLRESMRRHYGEESLEHHFADTRDTLCYATSENQDAIYGLVADGGDLAIVVGGYNSSNTSHLVKLCKEKVPTYYIKDADEILSRHVIRHLDTSRKEVVATDGWLPLDKEPIDILLTAGASCPDALVDQVLDKLASLFNVKVSIDEALNHYRTVAASA